MNYQHFDAFYPLNKELYLGIDTKFAYVYVFQYQYDGVMFNDKCCEEVDWFLKQHGNIFLNKSK